MGSEMCIRDRVQTVAPRYSVKQGHRKDRPLFTQKSLEHIENFTIMYYNAVCWKGDKYKFAEAQENGF